MSRTYLFSPIGNTDPVKYFYDGSMLHICRYYKPDVVYLYLSKEMMEYHRTDNRYVRSIELLGGKLNHTFEVHIIENDQMVNVQLIFGGSGIVPCSLAAIILNIILPKESKSVREMWDLEDK